MYRADHVAATAISTAQTSATDQRTLDETCCRVIAEQPARRGLRRAERGRPRRCPRVADCSLMAAAELAAPVVPVRGIFGEGLEEHLVEVRQLRTEIAEPRRVLVQVLADHRDRI